MNKALFRYKLRNLVIKLTPFYRIPVGEPHPYFPKTVLHFFLLNEEQIDELAAYYSQSIPDDFTKMYPTTMNWDQATFATMRCEERVSAKRRELGRFIGLSGY
ncbi:hypothetical protein B0J12DRAFT_559809 [Macrophomina phaseolina]|uniref:Uncharacterized protein n=1 Tax=Macrophomina phaseolina TaxID=35725 RepID=A0ABQ8GUZ2_9PEZI|nr:hypothetical protein B0J12DRAFT_559809 [Macrophomina phaseolina]